MAKILSISEIIGTIEDGAQEICATAEATHDEAACQMTLVLDCFVRPTDIRVRERRTRPEYLPGAETLREQVAREEASDLAKDAFHRWVRKVRQSIPSLVHH